VKKNAALAGVIAAMLVGTSALAQDQDSTTAKTPAQLIEALKAAGYDLSDITTVNEDGTVSVKLPEGAAEQLQQAEEAENAGSEGADEQAAPAVPEGKAAEPKVLWDTKLTIGFGYTSGNTQNENFNGSIVSTREVVEKSKLTLDAAYFYTKADEKSTQNSFTAGAANDWYLGERWIAFAGGRFDYDEFKSWKYRVQGHTGVGYKLINEDDFVLTPRIGVGASKEFGSDENAIKPEGLLGVDLDWKISKNQSLTASSYYYPDLSDISQFRWVSGVAWNMLIDKADGLSLTFGLFDEYESQVGPGTKHNDFKVFGGLTFDF
jgi:putative salt-induced outer membrane protein YdiY